MAHEKDGKSMYYVMSYTTAGAEYYASYSDVGEPIIGNSLHIAVSLDGGETYEPLNFNIGVLYAEADYSDAAADPLYGDAKMFRSPYLFRTADGAFGVITARADAVSDKDTTDGMVMIYMSEDLKSYRFIGFLNLDTSAVYEPVCVVENGEYTISWANSAGGSRKRTVTKDLRIIGNVEASAETYSKYVGIADFAETVTNVIEISKSEYDMLKQKLNPPVMTGIKEFQDISVMVGDRVDFPEKAAALYSDGSERNVPVRWDASEIDTMHAGVYTIYGELAEKEFPSDFIPDRADPCILKYDDRYYFTATRDRGGQNVLNIREAETIHALAEAEERMLYENRKGLVWAPEIHNIDGILTIFFADGERDWSTVQCSVMRLKEDGNPMCAEDWTKPVRIKRPDGKGNITEDGISLDMTCFKWENKWYLAWSQRKINGGNKNIHGSADIYIAEYNPRQPERLAGDMHVISRPLFGWERSHTAVDEGPFTLIHGGRLYMTTAVNGTDYSYGIKLMTLKKNGCPLNADDWETQGFPILASAMNTGEPGPGHSSFVRDENGDIFLAYHWGNEGAGRTTSIKKVHFSSNDAPILNIPRETDLIGKVKLKVTVSE